MNEMRRRKRAKGLVAAIALGGALAAGALVAAAQDDAGRDKTGAAPDPASAPSRKQWVFDITYKNKQPKIDRVRSVSLDQPISTARVMGRYAIELYIGKELLDRVRFNPPLAGDGPPEKTRHPFPSPRFDDVVVQLHVQIADNPRATYVVLVDRATGASQRYWWPPEPNGSLLPVRAEQASSDADAGKPDAKRKNP